MRTAGKLKNCFICGKKLCGNEWACSICFTGNIAKSLIVHKIPNYIPVNQEEKYLKLYIKKKGIK